MQPAPRVAFWVNVFPARYETFIANQVRGMIARAWDGEIVARRKGSPENNADKALLRSVRGRTFFRPSMPVSRWRRWIKTSWVALNAATKNPRLARRLLMRRSDGYMAAGNQLLYEALPFLGRRPHDIVFCAYGPIGNLAAALKSAEVITGKVVTAFRGADLSKAVYSEPRLYRRLFEIGDLFLPVSEVFHRRLRDLGCPESKIVVHHDDVDCASFPFLERRYESGEMLRLVAVGRLIDKKGIEYAIRAVDIVRRTIPQTELRVIGEGPLRSQLEDLIQERKLRGHVEFLGWLKHDAVGAEIARAHIMVQPSVTTADGEQEGIPTVLKEALASGLPVVATRHGGNPELVEDGSSGFLVPERDVEALAGRILDLAENSHTWSRMSRAGRAHVEQEFDVPVQSDRLHRLFLDLMDDRVSQA